jgi:hypothetical protein
MGDIVEKHVFTTGVAVFRRFMGAAAERARGTREQQEATPVGVESQTA